MKYMIVDGTTTMELEAAVAKAIKDGWRPQGGVACDESAIFYQAMVKE